MGITYQKFIGQAGKVWEFIVVDENDAPIDITGLPVTLVVDGNTSVTPTVTDGPAGKAEYVTTASDFIVEGEHEGQILVAGLPASEVIHTDVFGVSIDTPPTPAP